MIEYAASRNRWDTGTYPLGAAPISERCFFATKSANRCWVSVSFFYCFFFFPARTIKYDKLVLAVGAEPASGIDGVPGARERAIPFYSIEDSYRVKQAITKLKVSY